MPLRLVGAGLGRTGTMSLKLALEQLLGGPCYHMIEVIENPEHISVWRAAARGESVDWRALFADYVAIVDWPGAAFWPQLADAFPEAPVLLSHRSAEAWWKSASATIFPSLRRAEGPWREMNEEVFASHFTLELEDPQVCMQAMEDHNAVVRASGLGARLFEWETGSGWEVLCRALDLPVPASEFPHSNSTAEFRERLGVGGST